MAEMRPTETTVLGPDTRFKGEMAFDGAAKILGRFEGTINANGEIEIGPSAKWTEPSRATSRGARRGS